MAYGDPHFEWVASGSTGATASGVQLLLGNYNGLSQLNESDTVHIQVRAITTEIRVGGAGISNDYGIPIDTTFLFDLPAMRAGAASLLNMSHTTASANASALWTVWKRASL